MNKVVIFSESAAALLQYTTTSITGSRKRRANIAGQARPDSQARWQLRRLAGVAKIVEKGKVSYHTMVPYYGGGPKDGQKEVSVHRATNNNKHYLRATIMPNASDDSVDHNDSVEVALVAAAGGRRLSIGGLRVRYQPYDTQWLGKIHRLAITKY